MMAGTQHCLYCVGSDASTLEPFTNFVLLFIFPHLISDRRNKLTPVKIEPLSLLTLPTLPPTS
jgi:hypothetical protein